MLNTLAVTGPIYAVIGLGRAAGRMGIFSKADMRVLGTYVVKFALPALAFNALSQPPVSEILGGRCLLAVAFGSLAVLGLAFAWGHWRQGLRQAGGQLLRNPLTAAILAGVAVAALQLPISGVLARTINMLELSSTAVSLFVIGGTLVGLSTRSMRRDVSAIALGKLVLHPLAVGLMVWWLAPANPALRAAAVVFASVPMLSIYPLLAQKYGHEGLCAAALLGATLLSFVSISGVLWLLGPVLGWVG